MIAILASTVVLVNRVGHVVNRMRFPIWVLMVYLFCMQTTDDLRPWTLELLRK